MGDVYVVAGLGSMGKRRVRDLRQLTSARVIGVDRRADRREETERRHRIETMDDFDEALKLQPKCVFVSVPPHLHFPLIRKALAAGSAYFVECLAVLEIGHIRELIRCEREFPGKAFPSNTHLFHEATRHTWKHLKQAGKMYAVHADMSSWLPHQHPWEKQPGDHYEFDRAKGGGIAQIAYELSWMYKLLGEKGVKVVAKAGHISDLPAGFNDHFDMMIEMESGFVFNFHYTLMDKHDGTVGNFERFSTDKGIICNTYRESRAYDFQTRRWHEFKVSDEWTYEEVYVEEMKHLLAALDGQVPYVSSLEIELAALATILAAEESARTGKEVEIGGQ